ncbi:MAG: hypothetical protein IIA44_10210 [Acidobacteria bacterium]|nr:hypothetical protein [Acidobacteriota bacterium]
MAATVHVWSRLWVVEIDAHEMEALRKRIERRHGQYFRVREDDAALVFCSVEVPGAERLNDSTAIRERLSVSLQPTPRQRRISHSLGWAALGQVPIDRERTDTELDEDPLEAETQEAQGQNGRRDMDKGGHQVGGSFRLVLKESPTKVLRVLKELGCTPGKGHTRWLATGGDGELAEESDSEHQHRKSSLQLWATPEASELLRTLADDGSDPEARLHRAWRPRRTRRSVAA